MPPAEIVSTPSSSAQRDRGEHRVGVADPDERAERERALVLDARGAAALRPQDPLAADRARRAGVAHRGPVLERELRASPRRSCGPGSAESALNVSRLESVPASRYFAVAGPNERARRSFAAASTAAGSCDGRAPVRAHGDRLEPLGAHHRAEPAAARVAAVVRDGREADQPLARGPDRRDAVGGAEPLAQRRLGLRRRAGPRGRPPARAARRARRRRARSARRRRRGRRSRRCRCPCRRSRSGWRRARR